jgi:hypothetical protein
MRLGRPLSPFRTRELARAFAPGQRPRSDDDIERFVGLMRLLAPFAPLAGLRQRSVFAARATREGDQHFGRQLPELVLAHPVW